MALEEIEPIVSAGALSGVSESDASIVNYLHEIHAPSVEIALAEAQVRASESTEQLAAEGDSLAIATLGASEPLALNHGQDTPALAALHRTHPVGPDEAQKGNAIDVYD